MTINDIENILSQTQCGECGYNTCNAYAKDLHKNNIAINRCRPGGKLVIQKLAKLLNKQIIRPALPQEELNTAKIYDTCIGCTLCIQACPTNCITGSPRTVHKVNNADCTGCKLCVKICPENCIDIIPNPEFSFVHNLNTVEKKEWYEKRRDKVHELFKQRTVNSKKLKTKKNKIENKKSLSLLQMDLINKARAKSKKKYSS